MSKSKGGSSVKKSRPRRNEAVIPAWWLEVTPHYTLDLEDERSRRMAEERMARYYADLAEQEAAKGMMFDIDGNPITEQEQQGGAATGSGWKSNWAGRQKKDGNGQQQQQAEKPKMFGGRNFKPGSEGWDPKQWGIDANDADYDKYQKGELLPPQFLAAMNNFAKATGHYKQADHTGGYASLKSTAGTMYGAAAEKQQHQPDWMKKKLRSTTQGQSIRHGVYDDSPNKHLKTFEEQRAHDLAKPESGAIVTEAGGGGADDGLGDGLAPPSASAAPAAAPRTVSPPPPKKEEPEPAAKAPTPKYGFKDFYYNAKSNPPPAAAAATTPKQPSWVKPQPTEEEEEAGAAALPDPDQFDEEEYVEEEEEEYVDEEEVVEEEEYDEEVEEEEYVEEETTAAAGGGTGSGDEGELEDLQATLAAKMEELKRLQAM